eukprot:106998-Lingulodinium_polyedra.AAC.1
MSARPPPATVLVYGAKIIVNSQAMMVTILNDLAQKCGTASDGIYPQAVAGLLRAHGELVGLL